MREPLLALAVLALAAAAVATWVGWRGRRAARSGATDLLGAFAADGARALILAFSTPECAPCKTVQRSALEALEQAFPGLVAVRDVDALARSDLARRFGILTVPSTVVIGRAGEIRAINHGIASTERLAVQAKLTSEEGTS